MQLENIRAIPRPTVCHGQNALCTDVVYQLLKCSRWKVLQKRQKHSSAKETKLNCWVQNNKHTALSFPGNRRREQIQLKNHWMENFTPFLSFHTFTIEGLSSLALVRSWARIFWCNISADKSINWERSCWWERTFWDKLSNLKQGSEIIKNKTRETSHLKHDNLTKL